jgi:hypothetical protein
MAKPRLRRRAGLYTTHRHARDAQVMDGALAFVDHRDSRVFDEMPPIRLPPVLRRLTRSRCIFTQDRTGWLSAAPSQSISDALSCVIRRWLLNTASSGLPKLQGIAETVVVV